MSLQDIAAQLRVLDAEVKEYLAHPPPSDRYDPPIVDFHHPDEYSQGAVQGMSKFLHHVQKERAIVEALVNSPNPPVDFSSNLVSLQGVWDAFMRGRRPLVGIWQAVDRKHDGAGPSTVKVDVVADGGNEWVKVNTIKESRLMVEFREHDSYINSDYDTDSDDGDPPPPLALTNSLLTQSRTLVEAARTHTRLPGLPRPRVRYVLTRLEEQPVGGYADPRITQTFAEMRKLGIELDFAPGSESRPITPPPPTPTPPAVPAADVILDLSVLIALCCDSTHYPLPRDDAELQTRFRTLRVAESGDGDRDRDGDALELAPLSGATSDLRDQLQCEMVRPLILELRERFDAAGVCQPRFWCTREVRDRLPGLVEVIGGTAERARAKALFHSGEGAQFWDGSRWEGNTGCLEDMRVRVLEDDGDAPPERDPEAPFDAVVAHVCEAMIAVTGDDTPPSREPTPAPTKPVRPPKKSSSPGNEGAKAGNSKKSDTKSKGRESRNPLRPGRIFPPSNRLPSGHTLRTMLAGVRRRATVLTNNRGAVLKVMREAGVTDGIPREATGGSDEGAAAQRRARIWVVNPSSLAEWRRIEVEETNARLRAGIAA